VADPHHIAVLDGLDVLTVRLYRAGFAVSTLGVAALALSGAQALDPAPARWLAVAGVTLSAAHVHLYDKRFRWLIPSFAWAGLLALCAPSSTPAGLAFFSHLGLGLCLVSLSALALKEQLCFRVPGLRLVPLGLAIGVFASYAEQPVIAAVSWGAAAAVLAALTVAKARMPLHFDIGDRSHYQL
jgi:uncharacterized integral membrane protein